MLMKVTIIKLSGTHTHEILKQEKGYWKVEGFHWEREWA